MADARIIEAICRMPAEYERRGNVSMIELLRESGYLKADWELTEVLLQTYLSEHPEAIEAWLAESRDQRVSEGWYLQDPEATGIRGRWLVGYYPNGPRMNYSDGVRACAAFIKQYVARMRTYASRAS
jgi:hypothetical protein